MKKFVSILLILALTLVCFAVAETTEETTYLIDDTEVTGTVCKARIERDGWGDIFDGQSNEELFVSSQSEKYGMAKIFIAAFVMCGLAKLPSDFDIGDIDITDVKMCLMTDGVLLSCFTFNNDNRVGYFACYPSTTEFSCGIFESASSVTTKSKRLQNVLDLLNDNGCLDSYVKIPFAEILDLLSELNDSLR